MMSYIREPAHLYDRSKPLNSTTQRALSVGRMFNASFYKGFSEPEVDLRRI